MDSHGHVEDLGSRSNVGLVLRDPVGPIKMSSAVDETRSKFGFVHSGCKKVASSRMIDFLNV